MKKVLNILILSFIGLSVSSQSWTAGSGVLYSNPTNTRIGVGITAPTELFHINGGALKIGNGWGAADRAINMIRIGDGDYIQIGEWEKDNQLSFKASSYSFTGGKIGIGTNNPIRELDVRGSIAISLGSNLVWGSTVSEGYNRLRILQGDIHGYIDFMENLHFRADKNWISALTLYGDGSVGVGFGTTYKAGEYLTNGFKFAVNGTMKVKEVTVTLTGWPDFVFASDYELKSLPEFEKYIKANKHLPDVPTAEEVETEGVKLGEMNAALLKKVEELTLYLIEQNKKVEELQKQVEELKIKQPTDESKAKMQEKIEAQKGGEE